jgi:predicted ArsR family transcriptional regulator
MKSKVTLKNKLLASFNKSESITLAQAARRFRVSPNTITKTVYRMRQEGVDIYTNQKTTKTGRKISFYSLGKPTRRALSV